MDRYGTSKDEFDDVLETARSLLAGECESSDALDANRLINGALSMRPDSIDAWIVKCQIMSALDDDTAALAAIEMALQQNSSHTEVHYWRTVVLSDLERYTEALASIECCFRLYEDEDSWLLEDMYCEKAMILDSLGREEDAVKTYEEGLRECPSSSLLRSSLAPLRRAQVRANFKVLRGGLG
jgi:tetratricopeptide (TPR) repeat protein